VQKGLLILVLALVAALAGYALYYRTATAPAAQMLAQPAGELEWLQREYHLTAPQFARIQQLHRDYAPACEAMCARISQANARLDRLIQASPAFTPEIDAAMAECLTVQADCRRALLRHVYAVAAEMSPPDGARYTQMMKQRIVEPPLGHHTAISPAPR
jgi:hypothetical protein